MARSFFVGSILLAAMSACVFLVGCGDGGTPVTAQTSKFKPVDSTGKKPAAAEAEPAVANENSVPVTPEARPAAAPGRTEGTDQKTSPPDAVASNANPAAAPATPDVPKGPAPDQIALSPEVEQIIDAIDQLKSAEPQGNSREEQLQQLVLIRRKIVELCTSLLNVKADPRVHNLALQQAQLALRDLAELRDPSVVTRMTLFSQGVAKHSDPEISRQGRLMSFNAEMIGLLEAGDKVDREAIMKRFKTLLDQDGESVDAFQVTTSFCQILAQSGQTDLAVDAMQIISEAFKDAANPDLAKAAQALPDSARVMKLNIPQQISDVLDKKEGAEAKLVADVENLLQDKDPNPIFIQPVVDVLKILEQVNMTAAVTKLVGLLETAYTGHENVEAAKFVTEQIVEPSRKRYALVGQPFTPDVVSTDGKVLDVGSFQGKVVLVAIWGTVAQTSLEEMPVLRKLHEDLKDKGFEVVGLDVDVDLKRLDQFMRFQRGSLSYGNYLSPEVVGGEKLKDWHDSSIAKQFGVQTLPFYLLVGKDGKIDSIYHSRLDPERLGGRMKELLGLEEIPVFAVKPKPMVIENPLIPKAAPIPSEPPPATDAPKGETPKGEAPKAEPNKQSNQTPRGTGMHAIAQSLMSSVLGSFTLNGVLFAEEGTEAKKDETAKEANPYLAKPGLSAAQLTDWVLRMLDKPKTIQNRPGFAAAIAEACDRVLADKNAKETEQLVAIENKLAILHKAACNGDDALDKELAAFVAQLKEDARPRVARETGFYLQERKVLDASEAKPAEIAALLKEMQDYFAKEKLAAKHLRMASATVDLVNKLEDGDAREKHFAEFGNLFAKSSDKELARYGKKLAKKPETKESDLIGKPLELVGNTAAGLPFAWEKYRGKVVVVDFWATWCGPCRKEMPNVKAFLDKHKDKGFEVVGVSVDKDLEALETFLDENDLPWETLAGDEAGALAEKYGVRAIPTMMLVDQKGNIVAVAHNIAALAPEAEKLLAANGKK